MISETQLAEIRNYLLDKKLPIDILMEVQDHFVSQINDLIREENLSFDDAFEKVKFAWKPELRLVVNPNDFTSNISILIKRLSFEASKTNAKKSFLICFVLFTALIAFAWSFDKKAFFYFFASLIIISILSPIIQYFMHFKKFRIVKEYSNYKLTMYQDASVISLITIGTYIQFFGYLNKFSDMIFSSIKFESNNYFSYSLFVIIFFITVLNTYCFIAQKKYLQQIEKVKPFLKYLKPSS